MSQAASTMIHCRTQMFVEDRSQNLTDFFMRSFHWDSGRHISFLHSGNPIFRPGRFCFSTSWIATNLQPGNLKQDIWRSPFWDVGRKDSLNLSSHWAANDKVTFPDGGVTASLSAVPLRHFLHFVQSPAQILQWHTWYVSQPSQAAKTAKTDTS